MDNNIAIQQAITNIFIGTDNRDWQNVTDQFYSEVNLDYSSMTGNSPVMLTPNEIISQWKTVLPGFTFTHHQLGNFIVKIKDNKAHGFCYGTAGHFLEDPEGSIWTVTGSYDFDLIKVGTSWKVSSMKFNYKYQNGNSKLIQKAIEKVKSN